MAAELQEEIRPGSVESLLEQVIAHWGVESQLRMLQEECGELVAAVNRAGRRRIELKELAGEVADVMIMCQQARIIVGADLVDEARLAKLARLRERLARHE